MRLAEESAVVNRTVSLSAHVIMLCQTNNGIFSFMPACSVIGDCHDEVPVTECHLCLWRRDMLY